MSGDSVSWIFRRRGLKPTARMVLLHLSIHHDAKTGRSEINKKLLTSKCVISRRTLDKYLSILEDEGLVTPLGPGDRGTVAYSIKFPSRGEQ